MGNKQVSGIYSTANQQLKSIQPLITSNNSLEDLAKDEDKDLHKDTTKDVSPITYDFSSLPTADEVADMMHQYRKEPKTRINGNLPESWKAEIDAYDKVHSVGKYALVQYAIGKLLGKV